MINSPTFLSIGDTVVDAFIELSDVHINCSIDNANCEICMKFGDKVPYTNDYVLYGVGNSANAAVSVARLGLASRLLTHLGNDRNGDLSIESLAKDHVETDMCYRDPTEKTNYHYVLWYKPERTILVKHEHYRYDFSTEISKLATMPDWVYLSSIGGGTEHYHDDINAWIAAHPDTNLVFQPGTFQMKLGIERLSNIYKNTNLFFCNVDEAERILGLLESGNRDHTHIKSLLRGIRELGPKIVALTDGPKGAYTFDGVNYLFCPMYPDVAPPLERTGAGDAYASTFSAFYAMGFSVVDCMLRAPINSMSVVQQVGAQAGLLTMVQINNYLDSAPTSYAVRAL